MNHGFAKHTLLKPLEVIQLDSHIMIFHHHNVDKDGCLFLNFFLNIIQLFFIM